MSLKIALLSICVILSSQFLVKEQHKDHRTPTFSNLGFSNSTGSGVTAAQLSSFINYINSAAIYYRDDTATRLKYISDQMNNTYGSSYSGFSIVQNPQNLNSQNLYDNYYLYIMNMEYATVAKVDRIFSNNSYLFGKQGINTIDGLVNLLQYRQRGYGMTDALETVIKNTILSVETQGNCGCYYNDLKSISDLLKTFDSGYWSVVCSSTPTIKATVYTYQGLATYVSPKACYYTVWRSS